MHKKHAVIRSKTPPTKTANNNDLNNVKTHAKTPQKPLFSLYMNKLSVTRKNRENNRK